MSACDCRPGWCDCGPPCDICGQRKAGIRVVDPGTVACEDCWTCEEQTLAIIAARIRNAGWRQLGEARISDIAFARISLTDAGIVRSLFLHAHWAGRTYLHVAVPVRAVRPVWVPRMEETRG